MVRRGEPADAEAIGRLLHDFNSEYEDFTPGPDKIAARVRELLAGDDTVVLLAGDGPDGLAVLRFRPSIWIDEARVLPGRAVRGARPARAAGWAGRSWTR